MHNISRIFTLTVLLTFCSVFVLYAQLGPPGGTGGPIDGGITALVIGSAYYGYKKLKANREKKGE